ncbi:MAG TPA: uroporphyrinogen decarboxylase family protein [Candidatus Binataceae bacterium]|nr:uroporphyrinogen decarboxylase family protein [Candidatus Binataceae bacterium]
MTQRLLLPTTVVGSYPQPDWLIDRDNLAKRPPPRVRAREVWRIPEPWLEQAQDDATVVAIHEMELAGVDIITDGEIRRESYSNRLANALGGVDRERPGTAISRAGRPDVVPLVSGPIRRLAPVEVRDLTFLRAHTARKVKITLPGPFTMTQQAENAHYPDEAALAMAYAEAVNAEIKDLFAAGADVVQIDEPYMQARPDQARRYGLAALNRALEGVGGTTAVHLCFGYAYIMKDKPAGYSFLPELENCRADQISIEAAQPRLDLSILRELPSKTIILGVIDLDNPAVESATTVAERIRAALRFVPAERLVVAPDCGMKYLARDVAFAKLRAMVEGARMVRAELV